MDVEQLNEDVLVGRIPIDRLLELVARLQRDLQSPKQELDRTKGVPEKDCWLSHTRPVWRLENGQAVLVAYEIYRGPKSRYGKIPGVFGRSEFGIEIVIAIAFQVYVVGLSFDKVCLLMNFFQNLKLRKAIKLTLTSVIEEIRHWSETGRSCFARLAEQLGLTGPVSSSDGQSTNNSRPSLLECLLPVPGG